MSTEQLQELGPIDYIVLEWAGDQPVTGEVMPLLLDLVDRGVIRILDLAFLVKAEDGSVAAIDLAEAAIDEVQQQRHHLTGDWLIACPLQHDVVDRA